MCPECGFMEATGARRGSPPACRDLTCYNGGRATARGRPLSYMVRGLRVSRSLVQSPVAAGLLFFAIPPNNLVVIKELNHYQRD